MTLPYRGETRVNPRTIMMLAFALSSLMLCATVKTQDVDEIESRIDKFSAEYDIRIAFKSVPTSDDLSLVSFCFSTPDGHGTVSQRNPA